MRGVDCRWLLFMPFLAAGRFLYQLGVWAHLRHHKAQLTGVPS
jgi:hypothetical protein